MKFSIIAALGAASLVAAVGLDDLPGCAQECAISSIGSASNCEAGDISCYCASSDFVKAITDCITTPGKCKSQDDLAAASAAAAELCTDSALVSSVLSSVGTSIPTIAPNATANASGSATTATGSATSTSTGAAANILPGGFAAAALVAAIFAW